MIQLKFVLFSLMNNHQNRNETEVFQGVLKQALAAERLGFDAYGVGERHGEPFLCSSPAVVLTAIAAQTSRIRLMSMVTVMSILDPVRVAEDYATLDHLSGGRFEMVIGKGNDPRHPALFGIKEEEQWASMAERYGLLKKLWSEENVTWSGDFRTPLDGVTVKPRPFQKKIPIWHGSASSELSTELVAKHNEPIFSSNTFHPLSKYKRLIDHYRSRLEFHGHDPAQAVVGAGARGLYIADSAEEAIRRYRPHYNQGMETASSKFNDSPFKSLEDHIERGSALVGTAEQVVEKLLAYHKAYGHKIQSISVDGLSGTEQEEQLERFAADVMPVLRREIPNTLWKENETALI